MSSDETQESPGFWRFPDIAALARRFWKHVDTTGDCWLWTAACFPFGHGRFAMTPKGERRRLLIASRVVWRLTYGDIPEGLCVLHSCDRPGCVRPSHLFLGTHADNAHDRHAKGRTLYGEQIHNAKLTRSAVADIRQSTDRYRILAGRYGVSLATIKLVRRGIVWREGSPSLTRGAAVVMP